MKQTAMCLVLLATAGVIPFAAAQHNQLDPSKAVLVTLSKPTFPPLAKQASIWGDVLVTVTVHPDGATKAAVVNGHPMLKQAALESATQSRFRCDECGAPVAYSLVYAFRLTSHGDCCSAMTSPVEIEQQPPSTDAEGRPQTRISISAEKICLCDPPSTLRVRSLKCLYLWKCCSR